ncbi:MAG: hypothetical protein BZ135_00320 [Methanosphaera sp. rholeuAM6]|nr:MAG: hypothetical protein BZ135_00320 [Methanosphaera sp. rholeuAM6]
MIINVGGRTDIVNYYTPWLLNRLKEGFVLVRNPYNPKQLTRYSLERNKVDAIIFCSKNYQPILKDMHSIMEKYPIYCHYTITCYEDDVETKVPSINDSITVLNDLCEIVGSQKLSWRYDPILLTDKYTVDYHLESFDHIASCIHDKVSSCIFSFVDMYRKVYRNMPEIIQLTDEDKKELLTGLSNIARKYDMPLQSCAVGNEYSEYGILNSGCITSNILEKSNDLSFKNIGHTGCRNGCKCIPWRDIGEYDTCLNGCKYCYANRRSDIAGIKHRKHDPNSPVLIGKVEKDDKINNAKQASFLKVDYQQQRLF